MTAIICQMAMDLASWPRPKEWAWAGRPRRLSSNTSPTAASSTSIKVTGHEFRQVLTQERPYRRSIHCLRGARTLRGKLLSEVCGQVSPLVTNLVKWARSRQLHACVLERGPETILVCVKCGACMTSAPRNLSHPCEKPFVTRGRTLRRIEPGKHPGTTSRLSVSRPWPVFKTVWPK